MKMERQTAFFIDVGVINRKELFINGKIYGQVKASQVKGILEGLDKGEQSA